MLGFARGRRGLVVEDEKMEKDLLFLFLIFEKIDALLLIMPLKVMTKRKVNMLLPSLCKYLSLSPCIISTIIIPPPFPPPTSFFLWVKGNR